MITGESLPVDKTVGDQVIGSTNNLDGYMQVEVSHTSKDTTLSKIIRLVEEAGASKAHGQEITRTEIAQFKAKWKSLFPSVSHNIKVIKAIVITAGTKIPLI